MRERIELLVLDAHGVVLNNPLRPFLRDLAVGTGQDPDDLLGRWKRELRVPFWTGQLPEDELWPLLTNGDTAVDWRAELESRYAPGPAASFLRSWSERVPLWILSNHHGPWLHPRLDRFGLGRYFEQVHVSDRLRATKPHVAAFEPVLRSVRDPERVLFIDDHPRNVRGARELGLQTLQATDTPSLLPVDRALIARDGRGQETVPFPTNPLR